MNKRLLGTAILLPTTIAGVVGYWNSLDKMAHTPPYHAPIVRMLASLPPGPVAKPVGFIRLQQLVHAHPLSEQLATDDRQLYTLRILSTQDPAVVAHPEILAAQARLNAELQTAATQAQARLKRRAAELTQEERRAMQRLLLAARKPQPQRAPAAEVIAQADASMNAQALQHDHHFTDGISAEERAALLGAETGLDLQAKVALEAKAAQFAQDETALASQMAQKNSAERIQLRVRGANVALSDADAQAIKARLNDLDQGESLLLATKRSADHAALQEFAQELRSHRGESATLAAQNAQDAGQEALAVANQAPPMPTAMPVSGAMTPAPLDGTLRARLLALKQSYQRRFDSEQQESITSFHAKQAQLQSQFTALGQVDAAQRKASMDEVVQLTAQRRQTYAVIIRDIQGTIRQVAANRGIEVVLVDPLGVAPGVIDLTPEVAKRLAHTP